MVAWALFYAYMIGVPLLFGYLHGGESRSLPAVAFYLYFLPMLAFIGVISVVTGYVRLRRFRVSRSSEPIGFWTLVSLVWFSAASLAIMSVVSFAR